MAEAVIVSAVRTPIGRANKGVLKDVRSDDLAAIAVKSALERVPSLDRSLIEDVIIGCAFPEGEQGMNLARLVGALAGIPETAGGVTVNRFCASSLQAEAQKRSEEHTSELQSPDHLVCRLLLEKKKKINRVSKLAEYY